MKIVLIRNINYRCRRITLELDIQEFLDIRLKKGDVGIQDDIANIMIRPVSPPQKREQDIVHHGYSSLVHGSWIQYCSLLEILIGARKNLE